MRRIFRSAAASAVAVAFLTTTASAAPQQEPLDVLLTDDDGHAAPTLAALKQALTAAGHRVTVVAPCDDQSGSGTQLASNYASGEPGPENTITAEQLAPDVWSVCGSPGDAVLFGLQHVFTSGPPDVVVSGANPGQNAGAVANHSGTVGATIAAGELSIPAIAISVEIGLTANPPQLGNVAAAAEYTARVLDRLQSTSGGTGLLPEHVSLNINYPVAPEVKGTRITKTGRNAFVRPKYEPTDLCANCYVIRPQVDLSRDPVADSDNNALADDYVSITPLDGDWTASDGVRSSIRGRLGALR
ncbi:5'/3'-nucleotidase SurE [Saccharopolyspora shandongensis]|uniref:5'/3'-nucleotidase SurE n=1 Tax=Saccharopolyspora shandongensis TaxID=418495 RepID=UPI00340E7FB3